MAPEFSRISGLRLFSAKATPMQVSTCRSFIGISAALASLAYAGHISSRTPLLRSGRGAQIDANRLCLRCMTLDHSGGDVARNLEQGSLPRVGIGQTVLERHIGGNRRHFRYRVGESRFQITSQAPGRPAPRAACMTRSRPSAHELLDDLREAHLALDQGHGATLELDPTLVESVKHLDAGNRITHSLGAKDRAPVLARNGLCANRTMQRL